MPDFVYPASAQLQEVARVKMAQLTTNDPVFTIMPVVEVDAHVLMWEQEDDWKGLQQIRGLNGAPGRVSKVGSKRFLVEPGVYGEFTTIDELEMTTRRQFGTFSQPADLSDLVMREQDRLLSRRIDRLRQIAWALITTGTYSVANDQGVMATDTFSLQTYSASDWSTVATSTPLADFRAVKLLGRGKGVNFGAQAKAYANQVTVGRLLSNANSADLGGKLVINGNSIVSLEDLNKVQLANDLPEIVPYDRGYLDDAGTFQPFIADDKVAVVGAREDGSRIMDYAMTRNANNASMAPGSYQKVVDDPNRVPRLVEVHDGHNGGPRIYFPSAICVMSV